MNIISAIQKEKSDKPDANSNLPTYVVIISILCIIVVLSAVAGVVLFSRRNKNKQQHNKNEGQSGKLRFY